MGTENNEGKRGALIKYFENFILPMYIWVVRSAFAKSIYSINRGNFLNLKMPSDVVYIRGNTYAWRRIFGQELINDD